MIESAAGEWGCLNELFCSCVFVRAYRLPSWGAVSWLINTPSLSICSEPCGVCRQLGLSLRTRRQPHSSSYAFPSLPCTDNLFLPLLLHPLPWVAGTLQASFCLRRTDAKHKGCSCHCQSWCPYPSDLRPSDSSLFEGCDRPHQITQTPQLHISTCWAFCLQLFPFGLGL